ncbi:MAG: tRNA (guanosine(46)-N7)-methyltransferase TrmB [Bacteroidales bacterium]|nr:tRNA (guanosine(46)-N7)-methyltransferase TrmB [Bacteroidales bacterium]
MGKDKLRKFAENKTFRCLVQPSTSEVFGVDYKLKGKWNGDFFEESRPLVLELGCGKGDYTVALAQREPDNNYIGIDIKGARLWKGAKYVNENSIPNAGFLRTRIDFIESIFAPGEVSEIWITFADPQIGREKKRLTSPLFLERYRKFLKPGGIIRLKTDSRYLHEYTKALALSNGLEILASTTDLYNEERGGVFPDSLFEVQTFYEKHFIAQGYPITYLAFRLDKDGRIESPEWDEASYKDEDHHAFVIQVHDNQ